MAGSSPFSRRSLLKRLGLVGLAGGAAAAARLVQPSNQSPSVSAQEGDGGHGQHGQHNSGNMVQGDVDSAFNGFDPIAMLTDFDYGEVSKLPNGQTLRTYQLVASNKQIEIAPGVVFPTWVYNGQTPGPTLRCTEGDRLRIQFINGSDHPHTIHFHGIHPATQDGVENVAGGEQVTYEFDAEPFGLHLYHCHTLPITRHIHKGLYGTLIIDPPTPRPPAKELMMVMNAFDTNGDGGNEFYAVNTVAFHYAKHPIALNVGELVRVYLVNMTEFDAVNSFHLHANLFHVYRTGTRLEPHEYTDMITMAQGERHILEFTYKFPGQYMFHAHQSEFTELGWMGTFDVRDSAASSNSFVQPARVGFCDLTIAGEV